MKPTKAIKILIRQRDKVLSRDHQNDYIWITQTTYYIKEIFGEDSEQHRFIQKFSFNPGLSLSTFPKDQTRSEADRLKASAVRFLNTCIEAIKDIGVQKPSKQNFLSGLSDSIIAVIIGLLITVPGATGYFLGQYHSDNEKVNLLWENKELKDSLLVLKPVANDITKDTLSDKAPKVEVRK